MKSRIAVLVLGILLFSGVILAVNQQRGKKIVTVNTSGMSAVLGSLSESIQKIYDSDPSPSILNFRVGMRGDELKQVCFFTHKFHDGEMWSPHDNVRIILDDGVVTGLESEVMSFGGIELRAGLTQQSIHDLLGESHDSSKFGDTYWFGNHELFVSYNSSAEATLFRLHNKT